MSPLEKIIEEVQKKVKVKTEISPQRMRVLEDILKGKLSPEEGKKVIQKQYEDAEE